MTVKGWGSGGEDARACDTEEMGNDHWNLLLGKVEGGKKREQVQRIGWEYDRKTQRWVEEPLKLGKMQKPAVRKKKTSLERVGRIGEETG